MTMIRLKPAYDLDPTKQDLALSMTARSNRDGMSMELARSIPPGGADDRFAKYFAEITLDVVEEQTFQKRLQQETGPRCVHLRLNAIGQVAVPPHVEENARGEMCRQLWTGHPKVDRTMFILDRRLETQDRSVRDLGTQRHVPALRSSSISRKNYGQKPGPSPFEHSFRSGILNRPKKQPYSTVPRDHMDILPHGP